MHRLLSRERLHILLVEDDEVHRLAIRRMTREWTGIEVEIFEAATLSESRSLLSKEHDFDIALVDYLLPDGDILELFESSALRDTPAVIITARNGKEAIWRAIEAGAQDYLIKGEFDADLLRRSISFALERHRTKRLERRLRRSEHLAALGQFAAGVAHEFNNPNAFVLNNLHIGHRVVEGLGEQLDDASDGERSALEELLTSPGVREDIAMLGEILEECIDGVERISHIVRDMQLLGDPERDQLVAVEPEALVRDALQRVRPLIGEHVSIQLELRSTPSISVARNRITRSLVNVLQNALQSFEAPDREHYTITVRVQSHNRGVLIEVEDNGSGIPTDALDRIFEPFFTTRMPGEGTGLGLTLTRQIVEAHDGAIEIDSPNGDGTVVRIWLPVDLTHSELLADTQPSDGEDVPGERRTQILLADSSPILLRSYRRMLPDDYDVELFDDPKQLLARIRQIDADAIICDYMLSNTGGVALREALEREHPEMLDRLIFITEEPTGAATLRFLDEIEAPVLHKPIDRDKLIRAIESVLDPS
jgi:signal transduction histidine kinase